MDPCNSSSADTQSFAPAQLLLFWPIFELIFLEKKWTDTALPELLELLELVVSAE